MDFRPVTAVRLRTAAATLVALMICAAIFTGIGHSRPAGAEEPTPAVSVETDSAPLPAAKKADECKPGIGCVTNLPLPRFVSLKGDEGNARRGPGLTHRIDWVFTRPGMPLRITAEYEHWRRVEDQDGAGGWVHYSLLSGTRSAIVTLDMAELHDGPSTGVEVIAQAEMGVIARLLECQPSWCRISVDGEKGWVQKTALWGVEPGEIIN
ncbi:MAG: SH3 domain-containing protein [Paracoccaceae bacterium]